MEYITAERTRNGPYRNLIDFIKRIPIGRKQIEHLILVGAFDEFGLTQPESLYLLDGAYGHCSSAPSLFGQHTDYQHHRLHPGLTDYTFAEKCLNELHLLGFMVSGNILNILDLHPASKNAVNAENIASFVGTKIKVFGWPISRRVHPVASSGKPMLFMTIEDKTGCIDIVIWPRLYETMSDKMTDPGPFEIWGIVREEWGVYCLEARYIRAVVWSPALIDFERASERLQHSIPREHMYDTHAIVA